MSGGEVLNFYPPGPVAEAFTEAGDESGLVRLLSGPPGSGKTTQCIMEPMIRARQQPISKRTGRRHARFGFFRATFRELRENLLKSWFTWYPQGSGTFHNGPPMRHNIVRRMPDGEIVDVEIIFAQLDNTNFEAVLRGLELTGAYVNEANLMSADIWNLIQTRLGRFPGALDGGCGWSGLWADTNSFDEDHFLAERFVLNPWDRHKFFSQPAAYVKGPGGVYQVNPKAENLGNVGVKYYQEQIPLLRDHNIRQQLLNEIGRSRVGEPVLPEYEDSVHCLAVAPEPVPDLPLLLGGDQGNHAAVVIAQELPDGQIVILDELMADGFGGAARFGEQLRRLLQQERYAGFEIAGAWADPAGNSASGVDERTWISVMSQKTGLRWMPAPTSNKIGPRLEIVRGQLLRQITAGKPGLVISPRCKMLRRGFLSGYHWKRIKAGGIERIDKTVPNKNEFADIHDALQYLLIGMGLEAGLHGVGQARGAGMMGHNGGPALDHGHSQSQAIIHHDGAGGYDQAIF